MAIALSLLAWGGQFPLVAQQRVDSLVRDYWTRSTSQNRAALERFAAAHPNDRDGALALLAIGAREAVGNDYRQAIPRLESARKRLADILDHPAYYLAEAYYRNKQWASAIKELEIPIFASLPSPLQARGVILAAKVYLDSGVPRQGVELLREFESSLPQPQGLHTLARCLEASGDLEGAVRAYQRVYYEYPMSVEARNANQTTAQLYPRLGSHYPLVETSARFVRVQRLIDAGQDLAAREELQEMTTKLTGADRDRARVWLGKARYEREHDSVAHKWLKSLEVTSPEPDAERLYYLLASSRRLGRTGDVHRALKDLEEKYPTSPWRLEALVSAGNMYLLENDHKHYVPIFAACAEAFRKHERAAYCDWKVAWNRFICRRPDAADKLRLHLMDFPSSGQAPAAMYFLGRLAEKAGDKSAAKTWYDEIIREYPNFYYAGVARERMREGNLSGVAESPAVKGLLAQIKFPLRKHEKDFTPTELTTVRLKRARILLAGGFDAWGEIELRFAARNGAQGSVLAMELAQAAGAQGEYGKSLRYIKALAPGYLSIDFDSAPRAFWDLSVPLAYRPQLEKYSSHRDLELFLLAALIRQESEFDRHAVSRAKAYGLMQVLPSTGRQLARKVGVRGFQTSHLYSPDININMGTYYLRSLIDGLDGRTEAALASYNAGKSRVVRWLTWGDFQEPSEFIETIPFTETRNYVQTVLRNAEVYRRLYGSSSDLSAQAGQAQDYQVP